MEFVPRSGEDVAMAEQATDYLNYIIQQDNEAVAIFYSVFKDALMNKGGFVKWWWDDSIEVHTHTFEGLDEGALGLILQEEGVEAVSVEGRPAPGMPPEQAQQMEAQGQPVPQVYDVEIKRKRKRNQVKIETMPPEEFFVDAAATTRSALSTKASPAPATAPWTPHTTGTDMSESRRRCSSNSVANMRMYNLASS